MGRSQDRLELFGLSEDPGESSNLAAESGVSLEEKWLELEQYLSLLAKWRLHAKPSAPVELTPEQLDKLRALGYVHQP
jgi:hypothetical protein